VILRALILGLGALVAGQALLGACGLMGGAAQGVLLAAAVVASLTSSWRQGWLSPQGRLFADWSLVEAALGAALTWVILERVWAGCERPAMAYDALSFHLHFPAAWLHSGRLEIVPTVFGDVAPAYSPANVELLFHLLMAPIRSDYLARLAQLPFIATGVLSIMAAVQELGGRRSAGLCSALLFLLLPEVWWQSASAMVDLPLATLFLANVALLIRLWKRPCAADTVALGVALGLFVGVKYVALPLGLPLALMALAVVIRHRCALPGWSRAAVWCALLAVLGFGAGGFWYVRNWVVTGNPLYPLAVRLASWDVWPGLHDGGLMRAWIYHTPVTDVKALLALVATAGVVFVVAAVPALALRWRGPEPWVAFLLVGLLWFVVPYQHSRFMLSCFGMLCVALGAVVVPGQRGEWRALLPVVGLVGLLVAWPAWPRLAVLGAAAAGALAWWTERWVPLRAMVAAGLAGAMVLGLAGLYASRGVYPGYGVAGRPDVVAAWEWVHANTRGARMAYSGVNLPFPLHGRDLSNDVRYVNVAGKAGRPLHVIRPTQPVTNAEPAVYRDGADAQTWLDNLVATRRDTLFVASMFPVVRHNIAHDAEGFPVERQWAEGLPHIFTPCFANAGVRIYRVNAAAARALVEQQQPTASVPIGTRPTVP
jgi:hypothetical protein